MSAEKNTLTFYQCLIRTLVNQTNITESTVKDKMSTIKMVDKIFGDLTIDKISSTLPFDFNMQLRDVSEGALQSREDQREKAKAERISQQNTQQSKLINQRKNNLPPMNFESNEDSLDGFDFAEFSPR